MQPHVPGLNVSAAVVSQRQDVEQGLMYQVPSNPGQLVCRVYHSQAKERRRFEGAAVDLEFLREV